MCLQPVRQGVRQVGGQPAIISEKKAPIDSAVPEFWNVERMPDADAPFLGAGTEPMMDEELGEANIPHADPVQRRCSSANTQ